MIDLQLQNVQKLLASDWIPNQLMRIVRLHWEEAEEGLARDFALCHEFILIVHRELALEKLLHSLGKDNLDAVVEGPHNAHLLRLGEIFELHFLTFRIELFWEGNHQDDWVSTAIEDLLEFLVLLLAALFQRQAISAGEIEVFLQIEVRVADSLPDKTRCDELGVQLGSIREKRHHREDWLSNVQNQVHDVLLFLLILLVVLLIVIHALILAVLQDLQQCLLLVSLGVWAGHALELLHKGLFILPVLLLIIGVFGGLLVAFSAILCSLLPRLLSSLSRRASLTIGLVQNRRGIVLVVDHLPWRAPRVRVLSDTVLHLDALIDQLLRF